jgi:anti-anti-sigma factor
MVGSCSTVRKLGGDIKLASPQPRIAQLLEMTKLSAVFNIFPTEDTALHSFPGISPG